MEQNRRNGGKSATCAFTGHRAAKLPWRGNENDPRCAALKRCIYDTVEALYHSGVRHYISGMASGGDLYFCEAVLALRALCPEVTLEAAIPFEGQAERWPEAQRRRYACLVAECDYRTVISKEYTATCMMRRNRYMVDASAYLIAVYNGAAGGTRATLRYALRQGLEIIQLPIQE